MYHFNASAFQGPKHGNSGNAGPTKAAQSQQQVGSSSAHYTVLTPALRSRAYYHTSSLKGASIVPTTFKHPEDSLHRTMTMPDNHDEEINVHRSGSGGLIMHRRNAEEKRTLTKEKAFELSTQYELSDACESELNKRAIFIRKSTEYRGAPTLKTISPKEAAEIFRQRHAKQTGMNKVQRVKPPMVDGELILKDQEKLEPTTNCSTKDHATSLSRQSRLHKQDEELTTPLLKKLPALC